MSQKGLFKGFSQADVLTMEPRLMCAILSEQLARACAAIETQAEEIKALREANREKIVEN